jgi:Holliday junction resolvasome RuvABC DNA-binding subunit
MPEIVEIRGVGPVLAKACADNGYGSVQKIAMAPLDELVVVPGVSDARARQLIAAAQALLADQPASNGAAPPIMDSKPADSEKKKKHAKNDGGKKSKKKDGKKKSKKKKDKKKKKKK